MNSRQQFLLRDISGDAPADTKKAPNVEFLLLPHAGGMPSTYLPWLEPLLENSRRLGFKRPRLRTAVLPGHVSSTEKMDSERHSIAKYGERLAREIRETTRPKAPLIIFGHSMGALLAVETTRHLEVWNRQARTLILSGSAAPVKHKRFARRAEFRRDGANELRGLNDQQSLTFLATMGGMPYEFAERPEYFAPFLPGVRNDFQLVEEYRFTPVKNFPAESLVTLNGAADDRATSVNMTRWHELLGVTGEHREFSGGHFFHQQHVGEITALIAESAAA